MKTEGDFLSEGTKKECIRRMEDPPWIEEMKMREFERRNEVSMSE